MKTAHIICDRYFTLDGTNITIGGMQTYFSNLSKLLLNKGFDVCIYHVANICFQKQYNNCKILGFRYSGKKSNMPLFLFNEVKKNASKKDDLIIFGSDFWIVNNRGFRCVAIQHGIPWDVPCHNNYGNIRYWLYYIYKAYKALINIRKSNKVDTLVCVDYNYINWYRALVAYPKVKLSCIPNFSEIPSEQNYDKDNSLIRIIFARRLWEYRGTRIFCKAIERILSEYSNVHITIAGDGPDEKWMKDSLCQYDNVEFIRYSSEDSLLIHQNKNIAVVPTIGSEGTSLSILEAMAAKCAVICTDVGGLTNIILDNYNGLIVPAGDCDALYLAIKKLIEEDELRMTISERGYQTVSCSFSLNKWQQSWSKIIDGLYK